LSESDVARAEALVKSIDLLNERINIVSRKIIDIQQQKLSNFGASLFLLLVKNLASSLFFMLSAVGLTEKSEAVDESKPKTNMEMLNEHRGLFSVTKNGDSTTGAAFKQCMLEKADDQKPPNVTSTAPAA